jgi:hypothetical protein
VARNDVYVLQKLKEREREKERERKERAKEKIFKERNL